MLLPTDSWIVEFQAASSHKPLLITTHGSARLANIVQINLAISLALLAHLHQLFNDVLLCHPS